MEKKYWVLLIGLVLIQCAILAGCAAPGDYKVDTVTVSP